MVRLSLANPLEPFELAERTIEGSIQVGFVIQTRSALMGSPLPHTLESVQITPAHARRHGCPCLPLSLIHCARKKSDTSVTYGIRSSPTQPICRRRDFYVRVVGCQLLPISRILRVETSSAVSVAGKQKRRAIIAVRNHVRSAFDYISTHSSMSFR